MTKRILTILLLSACSTRQIKPNVTEQIEADVDIGESPSSEGVVFVESTETVSVGTASTVLMALGKPEYMQRMPMMNILVPELDEVWRRRQSCGFDEKSVTRIEIAVDFPDSLYGYIKGDIDVQKVGCSVEAPPVKEDGKPDATLYRNLRFQDVPGGVVFFNRSFPKTIAPPKSITKLVGSIKNKGFSLAALSPKDKLAITYRTGDSKSEVRIRLGEKAHAKQFAADLTRYLKAINLSSVVKADGSWVHVEGAESENIGGLLTGLVPHKGVAMVPLLHPGDILWAVPTDVSKIEPGRVVVLKRGDSISTRRVVGIPGDVVELECEDMKINGNAVQQKSLDKYYFLGTEFDDDFAGGKLYQETLGSNTYQLLQRGCATAKSKWTLRPGQYFVLGDNRLAGKDSRTYGPIEGKDILGVAWFVVYGDEKGSFSAKRAQLLH